MKFHLKVFDINHHWDESSAYKHGSYETYEEAVIESKKIIREFLSGGCRFGSKADVLMGSYIMYGKNPLFFQMNHQMANPFLLVILPKNTQMKSVNTLK